MKTTLRWVVLGPLAVHGATGPVPLGGTTLRAFLAVLLAARGQTVPVDAIAEALWGDRPPRSPSNAVQVTASRTRAALGASADRVESYPGGYRLALGDDQLDVARAADLFAVGRSALADGDAIEAAARFDEALALWNGPPLLDLTTFAFHPVITRPWVELRLDLLEARNDAYLAAGRHAEVATIASEQVVSDPWRERFRVQQVLALYRSSRQAEALGACDEHHRRLAEELGIAPCPELADLQLRILRQDPRLLLG